MNGIENYVVHVAERFGARLGVSLLEVYKLGSLADGGFSNTYSDIDVGLLLNCAESPAEMAAVIAEAKALDSDYGKKLSVFWGNPDFLWGRLPMNRPDRHAGSRRATIAWHQRQFPASD